MIKCSLCNNKFIDGNVCIKCGKAYCKNESLSSCPICEIKLTDAKITEERFGDDVIEWLTLNTFRVGLVDFSELPTYLPRLLCSSHFGHTKNYQIVVFPSKESSWKIYRHFQKEMTGQASDYDEIFEKSRYSIIWEPIQNKKYIFLNFEAITSETAEFLIVFLSNVLSQIESFRQADDKIIKVTLVKIRFDCAQKLGIPFIALDEETIGYIQSLLVGFQEIYAEYAALNKLTEDYLKEIPDFLRYKIELLFSLIDDNNLDYLQGQFAILNTYIKIASILAFAEEHDLIRQYIESLVYSKHQEVKKKIETYSDVSTCIDDIIAELSKKELYDSYESFLENVSRMLKNTFVVLKPRSIGIPDMEALIEISQMYESMIETGEEPNNPKFGSLDEFCEVLLNIFHKKDLLPESRIVVGQILEGILLERVLWENNYFAYLQGRDFVQELAQLIVNNIPNIKERLGKIDIGYHDACLVLIKFSQCSDAVDDHASALKFNTLSKQIAQKYDVYPIQVHHRWKDFAETHDYDTLLELYKFILAIDYAEHMYMGEYLKTISSLASAIFNKGVRTEEFDQAENNALAMGEPTVDPFSIGISNLELDQAIRSSSAYYHLVRLFRHILNICELDTELTIKDALHESQALSANIEANDPFNTFAFKTEILYALEAKDLRRARNACKQLKKQSSDAPLLKKFVEKVEFWISESQKLEGRLFSLMFRFDMDEYDPWERLFKKLVLIEMQKDFERHVAGADAIVFVEGDYDVEIFEIFAQKLESQKKFCFMDVEGFQNMPFYSEARLAKSLGVPTFVVFDGDTSKIEKRRKIKDMLVKRITLPDNQVLTLEENSIENYLLVPAAIKRAFPSVSKSGEDITAFFEKTKTKRNKKNVLDILFKDSGLGKYDDEKAVQIASKMKKSEIDEEIKTKLNFIAESC